MNVFYIKRGDVLPALTADLSSPDGRMDLSDPAITVAFSMSDTNGNVVVDNAAGYVVEGVPGRVAYSWSAGDTDELGRYNGEFTVTIGGEAQTFPTNGFVTVEVIADVSDLTGVPSADIDALRRMTGEYEVATFSMMDLAGYLSRYTLAGGGYDVHAAAWAVWIDKAARYAELVDTSEDSSSRALGDLYSQALKMADVFKAQSVTLNPNLSIESRKRVTRIRQIERP